jgi:ketosteroid isomerase-like protein
MIRLPSLWLILPATILACAPAAVTVTEADLDAIRAQRAALTEAVRTGNHDGMAALLTENAVIMPANEPMARGRMAYRTSLDAMPPVAEFSMSNEEFTALGGDAVLVTGAFTISLMPPGADLAIADTGKFLEVWRRQADGSWLMGWDIWNSDLTPPAPPAVVPARGR